MSGRGTAKRKRSLADELTELLNPAPPRTDVDVEDEFAFGGGAGAVLVESEEEAEAERRPRRRRALSPPPSLASRLRRAAEGGLRLRGEAQLGEEYRGVRTSRRAWAAAAGGAGPDAPAPGPAAAGGSESEDDPGRRAPPLRAARAALAQQEAALEEELAAVAASEAAAAQALRARAAEERRKAAAVAAQVRVWEALLELRIRLQKPLRDAARLPAAPAARRALAAASPDAAAALAALALEAGRTAALLGQLRGALLQAAGGPPAPPPAADADGCDALWAALEAGAAAAAPFRDAAIDKWHAKATLAASAAAAGAGPLRALNQPVSAQVAAALADGARARRRCAPPRSAVLPRLCEPPQPPPPAAADGDQEERDLEVYEDGEFYAQLLKELVEAGGEAGVVAPRAAKTRKEVDRRASKGRKLRYTVMPKLVNFVAAPLAPPELPPQAEQLLARLWGRPVTALTGV